MVVIVAEAAVVVVGVVVRACVVVLDVDVDTDTLLEALNFDVSDCDFVQVVVECLRSRGGLGLGCLRRSGGGCYGGHSRGRSRGRGHCHRTGGGSCVGRRGATQVNYQTLLLTDEFPSSAPHKSLK